MPQAKRIVFSTFGSFGDIHPYMAIALELQSRGHDPVIATSALYQEKIETAGLNFVAARPNLPPPQEQDEQLMQSIMHPRTGPGFLIKEVILAGLRDGYEDLLEAVKGADVLVTHPAAPAGPLVARRTGIPFISTVLAPMSFLSAYDPPVPPYWAWVNNARFLGPGVMRTFLNLAKNSFCSEVFDELRREIGVAEYGSPLFEGQHSTELILALFSAQFAQPQPDWPPRTKITGFAFYDGHLELAMPERLERFLECGPPPIVFTLGSSAVWVAQDFFRQSIEAARMLRRRAVLLIGDERNMPPVTSLSTEIIAVDYAPYQSVLPRACAMVHHGGIGTTSQGLRAGIPTLIVPFAFDQPDNASHAERLGTSRTLARKRYLANRVAKELDVLLSKPQYAARAARVGELIRSEDGTKTACDLIEGFLDNRFLPKQSTREPVYAACN
jgi:rhamnosyltransferase subunit B